jgi:hypothetical protein
MWSEFLIRYAGLSAGALHNCTASIVRCLFPLQAGIFRITEQPAFHGRTCSGFPTQNIKPRRARHFVSCGRIHTVCLSEKHFSQPMWCPEGILSLMSLLQECLEKVEMTY